MADFYTEFHYVENVDQFEFETWFEKATRSQPFFESVENSFRITAFGGYGGYVWDSLLLKMMYAFKGIAFEGFNQVVWDDHLVYTAFASNGKELEIERHVELPFDDAEELDAETSEEISYMRPIWEEESYSPFYAKFPSEEIELFMEVYVKHRAQISDISAIEVICAEYQISCQKFSLFLTMLDFENRSSTHPNSNY